MYRPIALIHINKTCDNDTFNYVGTYCIETNFLLRLTHKVIQFFVWFYRL